MCKVVSLSALDSRARRFAESFGGYGIVAVKEEVEERAVTVRSCGEECSDEVITELLSRTPIKFTQGAMW